MRYVVKSTLLWPHYTTIKKIFISHLQRRAREEFISFPCRCSNIYCAAWLFGLSAGDGAQQKWMILACISQPHYRAGRNVELLWCVRSFIRPIISCQLNERAQKRVGVCALTTQCMQVCCFFPAQPVWRILGYSV